MEGTVPRTCRLQGERASSILTPQGSPSLVGVLGGRRTLLPVTPSAWGLAEPQGNRGWLLCFLLGLPLVSYVASRSRRNLGHAKVKAQVQTLFSVCTNVESHDRQWACYLQIDFSCRKTK